MTLAIPRLSTSRLFLLAVLLLFGATWFAYAPGLTNTFVLDDYLNLLGLESLKSGEEFAFIFGNQSGLLGRPVSMASFVFDWHLFGFDISAFKRTNLILHLVNGALVLLLSGWLLRVAGLRAQQSHWFALWITALWLLTPMAVSSVLYTVQRMAQLSALFLLAGLLSYVAGRMALIAGTRNGWWGVAAALLLFFPLGGFSKENGALLPLLLLVVEWCFFHFEGVLRVRQVLVVLFVLTVAVPAVGVLLLLPDLWSAAAYAVRDFSVGERIMSESRVLWDYVIRLLWPPMGGYGIYHDDFIVSRGMLAPPLTLFSVAGWLLVALLVWRFRATPYRPMLFGPLFFLAGHVMESTILPLELYFEHRNYLPGFGLFFTVGLMTSRLIGQPALARYLRSGVGAMLLVLYVHASATSGVVQTWRYPEMFPWFAAEHHPNSPRLLLDLADVRASQGRLERAKVLLNRAAELQPDYAPAVALAGINAACFAGVPPHEEWMAQLESSFAASSSVRRPATLAAGVKIHQLAEFRKAFGCPGLDLKRLARVLIPWVNRIEREPSIRFIIWRELDRIFPAEFRLHDAAD